MAAEQRDVQILSLTVELVSCLKLVTNPSSACGLEQGQLLAARLSVEAENMRGHT